MSENVIQRYLMPVVIEKDNEGYFASCPILQGCYAQGDTYEEAVQKIEDAIRLHIEDHLENNEPVPTSEFVSIANLEV